jgi:hypothetical protein
MSTGVAAEMAESPMHDTQSCPSTLRISLQPENQVILSSL